MLKLAKEISILFPEFYLAGGTALMLKYRHRISTDLDFFSEKAFSFLKLASKVRKYFSVEGETRGEDNLDLFVDGIRISFVFFPFKNIKPLERYKGVKKADDYDIFLNKIYAAGRRVDPRDPYDVAFLLKKYNWQKEIVKRDFIKKFPDQSFEIYLGAVLSFEDYPEIDEWVKETLFEFAGVEL